MISKRNFLRIIGGGVVLGAAGAGGFAVTRTPHAALAPWQAAGAETEPRRFALAHALLAPNPHNLQPWMVDLSAPGRVKIWRDPAHALPQTDPLDRQIVAGFGCFLELMDIAAAERGLGVRTVLFPEGEEAGVAGAAPLAACEFLAGAARDPLFAAVMDRRSAKVPFDMKRPVSAAAIGALEPGVPGIRFEGSVEPARVADLRRLTWEAFQVEYTTPQTHRESIEVMRLGKREIIANPDGIDVGGPFLEALMLLGMLTREGSATPGTMAYQTGLDMYREMLAATPAYVWLASSGNTRVDQIAAGRAWLRLNLATTAAGLSLHPVSQALQEYPEMAQHYAEAHRLMARPGETVQMLGRLGYAPAQPRSPRWGLDAKIRTA